MCLGNEASLGPEGGVEEKGSGGTVGGALQSSIHPCAPPSGLREG